MAYLYRLMVVIVLCVFGVAHAAFPASQGYQYDIPGGTPGPALDPMLNAWAAAREFVYTGCNGVWSNNTTGCNFTYNGNPIQQQTVYRYAQGYVCPSNAALSGSSCTCSGNYQESGGACVNANEALCQALSGSDTYASAPGAVAPGASSCNASGCLTVYGETVIRVRNSEGVSVTEGSAVFTGGVCDYVAGTGSEPDACPGGTVGSVNGLSVCVDYDPKLNTIETVKGTDSTSVDDGVTTSVSGSSNTECKSGNCTTTTTTNTSVNGAAPKTKVETTTEPLYDFCKSNPTSPQCKDSGFSGSCAGGFTCNGDAVQCAVAKEVHTQNCKLNKETPEALLYAASKGNEAEFENDEVVNVGPASFSTAALLGQASCISDKSITVMGATVSLPFSGVCSYLAMLGNVLMAVGFLLAGRIIMRG